MTTPDTPSPATEPKISPWARGAAADPKQWFQKGYDPRRKPRGRAKIPEQLYKDMLAVWEELGEDCLRRAFVIDPVEMIRIAARLMPWRAIDLKALEGESCTADTLAILLREFEIELGR